MRDSKGLASDLVVGIIFGVLLMGIFNPYTGVFFTFRRMRRQIEFLKGDTGESGASFDKEFPNRKENS